MAAAAPPVSDCSNDCTSSSTTPTSVGLYPLHGTANPNVAGVLPPYNPELIWEYQQWLDAIAGPPIQIFYWNNDLLQWQ